jgi:hypothetical protein
VRDVHGAGLGLGLGLCVSFFALLFPQPSSQVLTRCCLGSQSPPQWRGAWIAELEFHDVPCPISPPVFTFSFSARSSYSERAPYINNRPLKTVLSHAKLKMARRVGRCMAEASFDVQMAGRQIRRIVALTCEKQPQPVLRSRASSYLAAVLVRTLGGIQSPAGEGTEISLL